MRLHDLVIPGMTRTVVVPGSTRTVVIPGLTRDPSPACRMSGADLERRAAPRPGDGLRVKPAMTVLGGLLFATAAAAQMSPIGTWRSIDDKTGEAKAEIRIGESAGVMSGRIEKRLVKDAKPGAVCEECSDERKGRAIDGLEIIRGAR